MQNEKIAYENTCLETLELYFLEKLKYKYFSGLSSYLTNLQDNTWILQEATPENSYLL